MAVYYFAQADLEDALGTQTVAAIFDEDNSGTPSARAIAACVAYGTAECKSFLRANYPEGALPATEDDVPDELKFAAIDFGCAYAARRRPDLVRAMGEESWTTFRDSAIEKMKRYAAGIQRTPPATGTPERVEFTVTDGPAVIDDCGSRYL